MSRKDVDDSTVLLTEFVVLVQYLYGDHHMTSNVHMVLHLPKSVLLLGPLWAHSCFPFESKMGQLLKLISSAKGVPFQILSRIILRNNFHLLKGMALAETRAWCHAKECSTSRSLHLLGSHRTPNQDVEDLVMQCLGPQASTLEYDRVSVNGYVLHSSQFSLPKKMDTTAFETEGTYAKTEHIIAVQNDNDRGVYVVTNKFDVSPHYGSAHLKVAYMQPVRILIRLDTAVTPCMLMTVDRSYIFADLCNKYEWST